jgi:hypothetical protein
MPDRSSITSFLRRPQNEQLICGMNGCRVMGWGIWSLVHECIQFPGSINGSFDGFVKPNFGKKTTQAYLSRR